MSTAGLLPVHGFVLAGGKSSRMGRDKALLPWHGRPMVEIAAEKLRTFCAQIEIVGNREDLRNFAPVVMETRRETGPVAGIEAGLHAAAQAAALFIPVDVPLVPAALLRRWAHAVLEREASGVQLSFLCAGGHRQPTFCLLQHTCADAVTAAIDRGALKLGTVFAEVAAQCGPGSLWVVDAESFAATDTTGPDVEACFSNVNTPADLLALEGDERARKDRLIGKGAAGHG